MKQKLKILNISGALLCMPVNSALERLWQEDQDIEVSLGYIVKT